MESQTKKTTRRQAAPAAATNNRTEQANQMFRSISLSRQQQPQQATTLRRQLGNKDLIIRMLAEVFQVNQSSDGQMRWEQVSSSLVPVSLYSRSTSRWLNYLLSASSVAAVSNHSSCAMSPDSRDFLLLLQQFHQQNRPKQQQQQAARATTMRESSMDQYENCVVFQVVAHDYAAGQCRKILNVKLAQPGTRLGQASEYFVYWKEQLVMQQQQQAPFVNGRRRFVAPESSTPLRYSHQHQHQQQATTWGLNFASVNDAKLFYDICSLNLVDLDFNSEYLKQFMRSEENSRNNKFNVCQQLNSARLLQPHQQMPTCDSLNQQQRLHKVIRRQFDDQNQNQKKRQTEAKSRSSLRGETTRNKQRTPEESNNIKCQSCQQQQNYITTAQRIDCPVHANDKQTTGMRTRSKSTTRRPATGEGAINRGPQHETRAESRRSRSFSTPASPEQHLHLHRDPECPVHSQKQVPHHPRCLNYMRQQHQQQQQSLGQSVDSENRHMNRGQLLSRSGDWPEERAAPQHENSASSAQSLHAKRAPKARYMGHRSQQQQDLTQSSKESRDSSGPAADSRMLVSEAEQQAAAASGCPPEWRHSMPADTRAAAIDHEQQNQADSDDLAARFITSRAAQRRSTACEAGSSLGHFAGSPTHRTARLARAQYANSKNMKEFLSLDAGGMQQQQQQQPSSQQQQPKQQRKQQQEMRPTAGDQMTKANPSAADKQKAAAAPADWQQTVGTTTEDLPLDPATRKRMFRLASEEAISERTEPRSSSTQTTVAEKRTLTADPCRASTVRPHQLASGERARSDASRRRSLERTMCVDLEFDGNNNNNNNGTLKGPAATLPPLSSFRKAYCLSPLPQSSKSSPSVCGLGGGGPTQLLRPTQQQQQQHHHHQGPFRSTPDVSQPLVCCPLAIGGGGAHHQIKQTASFAAQLQAAGSYAIPLAAPPLFSAEVCACERSAPPRDHELQLEARMRQSRSCPNSLRRKQASSQQPRASAASNRHQNLAQALLHLNDCQCQFCPRISANQFGVGAIRPSSALSEFQQQRQATNYCSLCQDSDFVADPCSLAAAGSTCMNNVSNAEPAQVVYSDSGAAQQQQQQQQRLQRYCLVGPQRRQQAGYYRPCSSLSSRSPLHFGLYESDLEDENEDEDEDEDDDEAEELASTCPLHRSQQTLAACCGSSLVDAHHHHHHHHHQQQQQQQLDLNKTGQQLRPVLGYDQTMARSSLKCRQRARSQPPPNLRPQSDANSGSNTDGPAYHLHKSMENVQKLIREVQNELDALRPLASNLQSAPVETKHQENTSASKMSRDEDQQEKAGSKLVSLSSATRPAGQFKCVGAIRKAGFLSVKKWILKRKRSIELARKQGWKRYWVCLRGSTLLFYSVVDRKDLTEEQASNRQCLLSWIQANCAASQHLAATYDSSESLAQCYIEKEPRHLIIVEGAIAQPIPEHPKRDFVFCLSTSFGDAYLFQAACQLESDNWISAIHNACAASIARDLTRDEATKLFENRIRHLEIEAEKKLFLRQRLDSRLTSMSSIVDTAAAAASTGHHQTEEEQEDNRRRNTMRSLLSRLQQQLVALDTYVEQVHCEIYQLRCYIASCASQRIYYRQQQQQEQKQSQQIMAAAGDLPHPKALLVYVSKATKLSLIKLGVFTVSSFHAYIHARQGSAESILQRIQRQSSSEQSPTVELRVRSRSLSEQMLSNRLLVENVQLENETEKLIDMSNFKQITVKLSKLLHEKLLSNCCSVDKRREHLLSSGEREKLPDDDDDDRYSVQEEGETILVRMRTHLSSNTLQIIKQLLNIIEPSLPEMHFLNYYLQFDATVANNQMDHFKKKADDESPKYVAKRTETVADWPAANLHSLELVEKMVFRLSLVRRQIEEELSSAPFGISIGVQLFEGKWESLLSVHCGYIEWGSVADKAGLRDDDELLMINGVPLMDLDMMFVESLIQDDAHLNLVVRSSRLEPPADAVGLDSHHNWRSPPGDNDNNSPADRDNNDNNNNINNIKSSFVSSAQGTQVISDEYISSLVCPPPPNKSSAFLRLDSTLMRQKSDMTARKRTEQQQFAAEEPLKEATDDDERTNNSMIRAKSQHSIDSSSLMEDQVKNYISSELLLSSGKQQQQHSKARLGGGTSLASQLVRKTEQLTRLLGRTVLLDDGTSTSTAEAVEVEVGGEGETTNGEEEVPNCEVAAARVLKGNANALERLRKSILELIETEFAYIRHLETISEHYMSPLEEISFLGIADLKHLNKTVSNLIDFQRAFFAKLANGFSPPASAPKKPLDEYEELNRIVQQLDSLSDFVPTLRLISQTFLDEAEKFKIYSAYCGAYSRFQKLLHPKRSLKVATISASPNALDTFLLTGIPAAQSGAASSVLASGGAGSSRDFLRPLGSFISTTSQHQAMASTATTSSQESTKSQLKQLNEFLGHLDSSSSSASLSLPKSSGSASQQQQGKSKNEPTTFQKSAHQQSFESYLIKPIQRIVKYPMLLNSIAVSAAQAQISASNQPDELDDGLQRAVKSMESITSHVNDTQRVHDEFGSAFELIERQFVKQFASCDTSKPLIGPHQPSIGLSIEQLLYFGQVDWLNILEFNSKMRSSSNLSHHLFVFTSCVVFVCKELVSTGVENSNNSSSSSSSKKRAPSPNGSSTIRNPAAEIFRYQSLIPVSEVQVRSVQTSTTGTQQEAIKSRHKYQWELFRCSSVNSNSNLLTKTKTNKRTGTGSSTNDGKVYLLASPTNEVRNLFLRKIRYIIRESVRNMSLPLTRSPSSKSLSPVKKLSSSSNTNTNSSCSQQSSSQQLSPVVRGNTNEYVERDDNNYVTGIEVIN